MTGRGLLTVDHDHAGPAHPVADHAHGIGIVRVDHARDRGIEVDGQDHATETVKDDREVERGVLDQSEMTTRYMN